MSIPSSAWYSQSYVTGSSFTGAACMLMIGVVASLSVSISEEQEQRRFSTIINIQVFLWACSFTEYSPLISLQCSLIVASTIITLSSASSLRAKLGLPLFNQVAGWIILGQSSSGYWSFEALFNHISVVASIFPFAINAVQIGPEGRILTYFLAFSVCFVILSISVEGLFYAAYSATLYLWTEVEVAVRKARREGSRNPQTPARSGTYYPQMDDLRIAVFFLFFVQVGFFGTGKWVNSLVTFVLTNRSF